MLHEHAQICRLAVGSNNRIIVWSNENKEKQVYAQTVIDTEVGAGAECLYSVIILS